MNKDLLSIRDITRSDFNDIIETAERIKTNIADYYEVFRGYSAAMIFEKPSLRTRVTFEVAMNQFGGKSLYISGGEISLGKRESVADGAKNLSRWVNVIVMRTFGHEIIEELAENAAIPVINALTDLEHPCQALACMLTLRERIGTLAGKRIVFVGDGNNVAHSLMLCTPLAGMHFTMCCPRGYEPDEEIVSCAVSKAEELNTSYRLEHDPNKAVQDADLIYTDAWASMGQEDEAGIRKRDFSDYQVNSGLMAQAGENCLVSHCLPAHRGEEITSEILDSPGSTAFDEAENRLHAQKAVLYKLLHKEKNRT